MKMEKIKNYLKEHKTEILIGVGVTVVAIGGAALGFYAGRNYFGKDEFRVNNKVITKVFRSIPNGTMVNTFGGIAADPLKIGDLGALGEFMAKIGVPEEDAFTHFIAIGKTAKP